MKNRKTILKSAIFALGALALVGAATATFSASKTSETSVGAVSTSTISTITGYAQPNGSGTFIAIAANEVIGTYGAYYTGTVYDAAGNPLTLRLRQNGGTGGAAWANGGARRYEFHTEEATFKDAIGSGNTFYITKDTVFEGEDVNITFAKEYVVRNIYASATVAEFAPTTASFGIGLINNRPSSLLYRVGVTNMTGIAAGFSGGYVGTVLDRHGAPVKVTIADAGAGSVSGMRLVNIAPEAATSNHTIVIPNGTVFVNNADFSKHLVLDAGYRLDFSTSANYEYEAWTTASDYATKNLARIACDATGAAAPTFTHGDWLTMGGNFRALSEDQKALFVAGSSDEAIASFVARYSYVVAKYNYADFIGIAPKGIGHYGALVKNPAPAVALFGIAAASFVVTFACISKRKGNRE